MAAPIRGESSSEYRAKQGNRDQTMTNVTQG